MPSYFLVPSIGPTAWRALLADPEKHWRTGYTARALAWCWEEAQGFPPSVREALYTSEAPALREAELLLGIPEHQVPLPGGGAASQTDLWVLARGAGETISVAVEGKVGEPFGPTVDEWLVNASPGKRERLRFLADHLGLGDVPGHVRYQLLHRTASAILEARRFGARHAVLIVHSFSPDRAWLDDYQAFAALFGGTGEPGRSERLREAPETELHAVWVCGEARYLEA